MKCAKERNRSLILSKLWAFVDITNQICKRKLQKKTANVHIGLTQLYTYHLSVTYIIHIVGVLIGIVTIA